jgi:uncharacterized protein (DUF1778 family)
MRKKSKNTIKIELTKDENEFITRAAKEVGMSKQKFVESVLYLQIIESLKNIKKEDLVKVQKQEEEDSE